MGNRKLPFGYQMRFGDVIPHSDEAEAVQKIYQNYLAGASFRQIAEGLQAQGIPYDGDKQWNKNMVARILENERYTGSGPFPALIPAELFRSVQNRRTQIVPERTQTPAQKELRKLCGSVPPRYVERQVLGILNRLIHDPQLIAYTPKDNSRILSEQRQALNELLRSPPVDEEQARKLALDCAGAALDSIGPEEYETERLRKLFGAVSYTHLDVYKRQFTYRVYYMDVEIRKGQTARHYKFFVTFDETDIILIDAYHYKFKDGSGEEDYLEKYILPVVGSFDIGKN